MKKISIHDVIFATATIRGNIAVNIRLCGISSIADIIKVIKQEIGHVGGLLTISLRNMTQGWTQSRSVYLAPVHSTTMPGTQLTLF